MSDTPLMRSLAVLTLTTLVACGGPVDETHLWQDEDVSSMFEESLGEVETQEGCKPEAPKPGADKRVVLWPPNHKYHLLSLSDCAEDAHDKCHGWLPLSRYGRITHITSDEPEDEGGDGATCQDIVLKSASSFKVRAERQGHGDGRVYTVHYIVTSPSKKSVRGACKVHVPHDRRDGYAVDSGPAWCEGRGCPGGGGGGGGRCGY